MIRKDESKSTIFDTLVMNKRIPVIRWLMKKHKELRYEDADDIFQEAVIKLWYKYQDTTGQMDGSFIKLILQGCCYEYGHWLRKQRWEKQLDDKIDPADDAVETDFAYVSTGIIRQEAKERVYDEIAKLKPEDREFMEMCLLQKTREEIMQRFMLKNPQVVRNKRCKIVARLRKELNGQALEACPSFFAQIFAA